jgi:hypothetical protein
MAISSSYRTRGRFWADDGEIRLSLCISNRRFLASADLAARSSLSDWHVSCAAIPYSTTSSVGSSFRSNSNLGRSIGDWVRGGGNGAHCDTPTKALQLVVCVGPGGSSWFRAIHSAFVESCSKRSFVY